MAITNIPRMLPFMEKQNHPTIKGAMIYLVPSHHIWTWNNKTILNVTDTGRDGTYILNCLERSVYIDDTEQLEVETSIIVPINLF